MVAEECIWLNSAVIFSVLVLNSTFLSLQETTKAVACRYQREIENIPPSLWLVLGQACSAVCSARKKHFLGNVYILLEAVYKAKIQQCCTDSLAEYVREVFKSGSKTCSPSFFFIIIFV